MMLSEKRKPVSGKTGPHETMIWTDQNSDNATNLIALQAGRLRRQFVLSPELARGLALLVYGRATA